MMDEFLAIIVKYYPTLGPFLFVLVPFAYKWGKKDILAAVEFAAQERDKSIEQKIKAAIEHELHRHSDSIYKFIEEKVQVADAERKKSSREKYEKIEALNQRIAAMQLEHEKRLVELESSIEHQKADNVRIEKFFEEIRDALAALNNHLLTHSHK